MKLIRIAFASVLAAAAASLYAGLGCGGCSGSKETPKEEKKTECPGQS